MKRILTTMLMAAAVTAAHAQEKLYHDEFPLGDVTLLDGPLKKARDLNIKTLLQYNCDRLLAPYRKEAGLEPKAKTYPNWDGLDGHVGGHYLTAMAMNAATGNDECRQRMEYMISELQLCAEANAKNHPNGAKAMWAACPIATASGAISKKEISVCTSVRGHHFTICTRCMLVCATHGFTAAMSKLKPYSSVSVTGL